ncbi:DUF2252 domain-containing protein [Nocardioides sp.]|uniref:DUF2252 domain-containing protein n=1 Tax=Nocardioides sp. TaxID=35761 RepID=UPI002ED16351
MPSPASQGPSDVTGVLRENLAVEARAARGKAARETTPLEAHAAARRSDEVDPVQLLLGQAESRVPELVPIRHGRMLVSPFTFYRGAALVMAADLAALPGSGLDTQLCGDTHLSNFGGYASPERRLVFDINDFDETFPGPFEWDVKRLAASFVVAGRDNGFTAKQCRRATRAAVETYRTTIRTFATQPITTVWYSHLDIEDAIARYVAELSDRDRERRKAGIKGAHKTLSKARTRNSMQALEKLTAVADGRRRFVSDPPLITRLDEMTGLDGDDVLDRLTGLIAAYRDTLAPDRQRLLDHFELTDVAHKVVGVGSVGTRAWVLLFEGGADDEVLLLQAKQAQRSVLAGYAPAADGRALDLGAVAHEGERVVTGQRLMQATSDIFLGWVRAQPTDADPKDYYVRQLRDWKVSADIDRLTPSSMEVYARLCGWTLARAHARAGDRIAIAAYLGKSTRFDHAVADFAETYADLNEHDHATLAAAVDAGHVQAQHGV